MTLKSQVVGYVYLKGVTEVIFVHVQSRLKTLISLLLLKLGEAKEGRGMVLQRTVVPKKRGRRAEVPSLLSACTEKWSLPLFLVPI